MNNIGHNSTAGIQSDHLMAFIERIEHVEEEIKGGFEEQAPKIEEALRRARSAGRSAWDARKGAIVPDAFAGVKPLHDAWLEGWAEGQTAKSPMTGAAE